MLSALIVLQVYVETLEPAFCHPEVFVCSTVSEGKIAIASPSITTEPTLKHAVLNFALNHRSKNQIKVHTTINTADNCLTDNNIAYKYLFFCFRILIACTSPTISSPI